MQRIIKIICIAICVGVLPVACSSAKSFNIQDAAKVELRSGSAGDKQTLPMQTSSVKSPKTSIPYGMKKGKRAMILPDGRIQLRGSLQMVI